MLWMRIINDATGDVDIGHYNIDAGINNTVLGECRIEDYQRANGWHHLVARAAKKLYEAEEERLLVETLVLGEVQSDDHHGSEGAT